MENSQEEKTLLAEMVEGLTSDVALLIKLTTERPEPATPPDLSPFLQRVADAIKGLRGQVDQLSQVKPQAPTAELTKIEELLRLLRQDIRQSPAYQVSKAVQYGAVSLIVSLLATGVLAYYATKWRAERDAFEGFVWKWRYTRQANPSYAAFADAKFPGDNIKADLTQWVVEREIADQKREAARRAAEQAKVMNAQADELEGKKQIKGRKSR